MYLKIKRDVLDDEFTLGKLSVNGQSKYFTVEDTVREILGEPVQVWKKDKITAIPAGVYNIIIDMSPHFKRLMPIVLNVPGFSGVLIHSGNNAFDTEGCIIVGTGRTDRGVSNSRAACIMLQNSIQAALNKGEKVTLTIE